MTRQVVLDPDGRLQNTGQFGLFLIVEAPTGVYYQHQCAGINCDQRELEGYLVPVGGRKDAQPFIDFFGHEFEGHDYPSVIVWTGSMIERLNRLVRTMPSYDDEGGSGVLDAELDIERLGECTEAWVPVKTQDGNAILIFENFD